MADIEKTQKAEAAKNGPANREEQGSVGNAATIGIAPPIPMIQEPHDQGDTDCQLSRMDTAPDHVDAQDDQYHAIPR
jgi:hypothetical protein